MLRGKLTRIALEMAARPQGVSSRELAALVERQRAWAATELRRQVAHGRLELAGGSGVKADPLVYRITTDGEQALVKKVESKWDFSALWAALGPGKF